jgi:hypothetical protein
MTDLQTKAILFFMRIINGESFLREREDRMNFVRKVYAILGI